MLRIVPFAGERRNAGPLLIGVWHKYVGRLGDEQRAVFRNQGRNRGGIQGVIIRGKDPVLVELVHQRDKFAKALPVAKGEHDFAIPQADAELAAREVAQRIEQIALKIVRLVRAAHGHIVFVQRLEGI